MRATSATTTRRRGLPLLLVALAVLAPYSPLAGREAAQQPGEDPIAQNLFAPELIMKYSGDIGLDARQRGAIRDAVKQAQSKFLDAQWLVQEESGKLVHLLQANPVDEKAALAQAEKLMDLEREVKKTQLSLLIRLKNLLTPDQQSRLAELRRKSG
jgi:Spy/CpxP family protein refolding chaperone